MSLFNAVVATCPKCGKPVEADLVASINADRRPDLRQAILDGTFQEVTCADCATLFRLPPSFTYVDIARGEWILAYPADEVVNWPALELQAARVFDIAYGAEAPRGAREIGAGLRRRIAFGWPAVAEKLFCGDLGLDDVTLELLKAAVMRGVQRPPFADSAEFRLVGVEDNAALKLAWLDSATEGTLASLEVPRDIYDDVAGDAAAWAELRGQLDGHLFVDLNRLLVPAAAAALAA